MSEKSVPKRQYTDEFKIEAVSLAVAANVLDRRFDGWPPDRAWVSDITFVRTGEVLAVSRGDSRSGEPARRGLVHVRAHRRRAGLPSTAQRVLATQTGTGTAITLGQRGAICKPGIPEAGHRIQGNDLNESPCQCVGQRPDGKLLQDPESREDLPGPLRNESAGSLGYRRLDRRLLQSRAPAYLDRLSHACRLRGRDDRCLICCTWKQGVSVG